jgi:hypothetical protein
LEKTESKLFAVAAPEREEPRTNECVLGKPLFNFHSLLRFPFALWFVVDLFSGSMVSLFHLTC